MKISMIHYWRTEKFWLWETFTYYFIKRHYHTFAKLAVLCLWIISMASCMFEETVIKQKSDAIKWERDTGIRKLLNIDGFFYCESYIGDSCVYKGDPKDRCGICFFDDGTFVGFNVWDPELLKRDKDKDVIWLEHSGVYTLSHDTIIVESFNRFDFPKNLLKGLNVRYPDLWRLKIIDRNTLEEIDGYDLADNTYINKSLIRSFGKYIHNLPFDDKTIYHFSDTYVFPTSDIKMKKKSWLWTNQEDWKKWMLHWEEQKKIKKPYKIKYHD
ncbi:MAG: hypothetical protein IKX22_05010 [Prevotella sp.]|nr:hypothetical protein [Prevotella sp.]